MAFALPTLALVVASGWMLSACSSGDDRAGAGSGGAASTGTSTTLGTSGTSTAGSGGTGTRDGSTEDANRRTDASDGATLSGLAKVCTNDADCGGALTCLKDTDDGFFDGGPAHGYCTLDCSADVTSCAPYGGLCVNVARATSSAKRYCLSSCEWGVRNAMKCGRADVGCQVVNSTTGATACIPVCASDTDCTGGRKCDPRYAVCVDAPNAGGPTGSYCLQDPDASANTCAGLCILLGSSSARLATVCSSKCILGQLNSCNHTPDALSSTAGVHGACLYGSSSMGVAAATGDIGHCAEECDKASDCHDQTDPGAYCDLSSQSRFGHGHCWFGSSDAGVGSDAAPVEDAHGQ